MQNKHSIKTHLKFIIPSLLGVFLFMTPIKVEDSFTISIAILAGFVEDGLADYLSLIMMLIIVLTALLTVLVKFVGGYKYSQMPFIEKLFNVNLFWMITRIVAAVFVVMVYFQLGTEAIYSILICGIIFTVTNGFWSA